VNFLYVLALFSIGHTLLIYPDDSVTYVFKHIV